MDTEGTDAERHVEIADGVYTGIGHEHDPSVPLVGYYDRPVDHFRDSWASRKWSGPVSVRLPWRGCRD